MLKITFLGAGSTVFARNVLGDCMCTPALQKSQIALYDIDEERLIESKTILDSINSSINKGRAEIKTYLGEENRKAALRDATFVVNAIQVGGYEPSTMIDFEIPKKYGVRQTIADTLGIGGIMRGLRTIPVMKAFADDIEEVCPNAWFLNYTNPMAMLTGYMQRYTNVKTIGLCHSVQVCSKHLLKDLDMGDMIEGRKETIAGINHMAWLLAIKDRNGEDLYPEIKRRISEKVKEKSGNDLIRYDYVDKFGYYCTESSEHNAEYNAFYIKSKYPQLIEEFKIPLDEYPRRCRKQIAEWKEEKEKILESGNLGHERSEEYASYIMEAIVTNTPYQIGGNVINHGLIDNLVTDACVEVPCLVNGMGIHPCYVGKLPVQLAALNMTNINVQLLTIEAAVKKDRKLIYQAAAMDPHTGTELSLTDIQKLCDELIAAHGKYMNMY